MNNKVYLWNENAIKILQIKFIIDLDTQIQNYYQDDKRAAAPSRNQYGMEGDTFLQTPI